MCVTPLIPLTRVGCGSCRMHSVECTVWPGQRRCERKRSEVPSGGARREVRAEARYTYVQPYDPIFHNVLRAQRLTSALPTCLKK